MPRTKKTRADVKLTSLTKSRPAKQTTVPFVECPEARSLGWAVGTLEALGHQRGVRIVTGEVTEDVSRLPEEVVSLAGTHVNLAPLSPSSAKAATVAIRARALLEKLKPELEALLKDLGSDEKVDEGLDTEADFG